MDRCGVAFGDHYGSEEVRQREGGEEGRISIKGSLGMCFPCNRSYRCRTDCGLNAGVMVVCTILTCILAIHMQ